MRTVTVALPVGDYIDSPRMVLRDGTVASVRVATRADREALRRFFHDLSPESRHRRFFTPSEPSDALVHRLSDAHDPSQALTLMVHRQVSDFPRDQVLGVVDDCAAAGIKSIAVITAGFAEVGESGRALQQQLVERVRNYGMRMVGPNCMGLLNAAADVSLNASFSPVMPPPGSVAFSSQSGALGLAILELARQRGVGLSTFVSVGNKGDVSSNDLLQYWELDPATSVILLYLESFGNARRFGRIARRIARTKPIVAVKAGRTRAGSRAAGSHTAALAASDAAVNALFLQSGVIRADTIDEMFDIAACLEAQLLPAGLLHEVRGYRLLEGYRGHPAADIDALRDIVLRIARLAEEVPEIVELDLNPVIALPPGIGCRIVDARIRIARR